MEHISDLLRLLGDDNRLRILHLLELEPLTVAELQEVLNLSQSSVSSHLGKLKRAGFLHDLAEGSAHRYRLREDLQDNLSAAWRAVHGLSVEQPHVSEDRQRLHILRSARKRSWVERVAGHLHREYAPGRTWEAMGHAFLSIADLGDCVDVGAGDGAMAELLAASCRSLVCIDPSPAMVAAGEARMRQAGLSQVRYQQAAGEALPVADGACDSVLFMQSLQYIPDHQAAIGEALRALRPGGRDRPGLRGLGMLSFAIGGAQDDPVVDRIATRILSDAIEWRGNWLFYRIYYDAVGMARSRPQQWQQYRQRLIPLLVEQQSSDGSWPTAASNNEGNHGPIYRSSLCLLALAVDRHVLPSYQR